MKYSLVLASLLLTLASPYAALASDNIDTGLPTNSFGLILDGNDWLAGQISFDHSVSLQSVSTYLYSTGTDTSSFDLVVYSDNAGHPGQSLFSTSVSVSGYDANWYGASNLNWALGKGNYWLGIEVSDGNSNFVAPTEAPAPLLHTAFTDGSNHNAYKLYDGLSFGVQVTAVPEPEETALMMIGLSIIVLRLSKNGARNKFA